MRIEVNKKNTALLTVGQGLLSLLTKLCANVLNLPGFLSLKRWEVCASLSY